MSTEDGPVMTLHPGVRHDHHRPTFQRYGADVGADIDAVPGILRSLDPALGEAADLIVTVLQQCEQLEMEAKS